MKEKEVETGLGEDLYARRLANKENIKRWYLQERAQRPVRALKKNGFEAMYVEDGNKAREEILKLIPESVSVGAGGDSSQCPS